MQLLKNYNRLQKQKDELEDNLKNTLSPTEQREQLLQQVRIQQINAFFNNSIQTVIFKR